MFSVSGRLWMVGGIFAVLALLPLWKLVGVQLRDTGGLAERGIEQRMREVDLPPERGTIYDRNGTELAISMPRTVVGVDRVVLTALGVTTAGQIRDFADALGAAIERDPVEIDQKIAAAKESDRFVKLYDDVDPDVATAARRTLAKEKRTITQPTGATATETPTSASLADAVALQARSERVHPAGESALRIIGTMGADGPGPGAGVERVYNKALSGTNGKVMVERGVSGQTITGAENVTRKAEPGSDVQLTLDRTMQYEAERILANGTANARAGSGIAVIGRPTTGELLAVAGVEKDDESGAMKLATSPSAFSNAYQAGSVFKLVTVSAAIEAGLVGPDTVFSVPDHIQVKDRTFSDHDPHPVEAMSARQIVAESSNVGTIMIAQQLGKQKLYDALKSFGFGAKTGIETPSESTGVLPPIDKWTDPDLAASAIGTHQAATPIQLWSAYNVIANGGRYVAPRLVDATVDPAGNRHPIAETPPRTVISPSTSAQVATALRAVVEEGTGKQWDLPGFPVAAKTGTSRMVSPQRVDKSDGYRWADGTYHYVTTFTGFFPVDNPQVSITVMLQDTPAGSSGSLTAGPIFSDLSRLAIRELGIAPTATTASTPAAGTAPTTVPTTPGTNPDRPLRAAPATAGAAVAATGSDQATIVSASPNRGQSGSNPAASGSTTTTTVPRKGTGTAGSVGSDDG